MKLIDELLNLFGSEGGDEGDQFVFFHNAKLPFKQSNFCSQQIILKTLYSLKIEIIYGKMFPSNYSKQILRNLSKRDGFDAVQSATIV